MLTATIQEQDKDIQELHEIINEMRKGA